MLQAITPQRVLSICASPSHYPSLLLKIGFDCVAPVELVPVILPPQPFRQLCWELARYGKYRCVALSPAPNSILMKYQPFLIYSQLSGCEQSHRCFLFHCSLSVWPWASHSFLVPLHIEGDSSLTLCWECLEWCLVAVRAIGTATFLQPEPVMPPVGIHPESQRCSLLSH